VPEPTTLQGHVNAIKEWIEEACAENPEVSAMEIEGDVIISYLDAEVSSDAMKDRIRRRFGR